MYHGTALRFPAALAVGALVTLIGGSAARAGEWEAIRESYGNALKANVKIAFGTDDPSGSDVEIISRENISAERSAIEGFAAGTGYTAQQGAEFVDWRQPDHVEHGGGNVHRRIGTARAYAAAEVNAGPRGSRR